MAIKATLEEIEECLREHEIEVLNRSSVEHGVKLTLSNKAILVAYNNCTCLVQGKPESAQIVKSFLSQIKSNGKNRLVKNIFIVYGHADTDRKVLENMIRKFGLNPLVLSDLPSKGSTLIEKLEEYSGTADYGVVLATPDDFGYKVGREGEKKYRARQNVVLELGMLLARLGRKRVAILYKEHGEDAEIPFEKPSDIHWLVYLEYKTTPDEVSVSLANELNEVGAHIEIKDLAK